MAFSLPAQMMDALMSGPAAPPPGGAVVSNPDHAPTTHARDYALIVLAWIVLTCGVAMRLFTRWCLAKQYVIEDFILLLAWVLEIAQSSVLFACAQSGIGLHMWDITLGSFMKAMKLVTISALMYCVIVSLIKIAILMQFLRIFAPNRRMNPWMFYACWTWIVLTPLFYVLIMILVGTKCSLCKKTWDTVDLDDCVVGGATLYLVTAWFNVISDVLLMILPLPAIYNLHMSTKGKLSIAVLFTAGAVFVNPHPTSTACVLTVTRACAASILRLHFTYITHAASDISWQYAPEVVLVDWEVSMGALVFCLPSAPWFFRYVRERLHTVSPCQEGNHSVESGPSSPESLSWTTKAFGKSRTMRVEIHKVSSDERHSEISQHSESTNFVRIPSHEDTQTSPGGACSAVDILPTSPVRSQGAEIVGDSGGKDIV